MKVFIFKNMVHISEKLQNIAGKLAKADSKLKDYIT